MTTNTSSNIKPITNPNPKVPVSGSDKYKSPNNETPATINKIIETENYGQVDNVAKLSNSISVKTSSIFVFTELASPLKGNGGT